MELVFEWGHDECALPTAMFGVLSEIDGAFIHGVHGLVIVGCNRGIGRKSFSIQRWSVGSLKRTLKGIPPRHISYSKPVVLRVALLPTKALNRPSLVVLFLVIMQRVMLEL